MLNTKVGFNTNANDVINSNDLRKRIINIDSRFRTKYQDLSTNFSFQLEHTYKNIIRLRVASIEIPNMSYVFSNIKSNTSFYIKAYDITGVPRQTLIQIPDGNYLSSEIITVIQNLLDTNFKNPYGIFITVSLDNNSAKVTFTHNGVSLYPVTSPLTTPTQSAQPFVLDFLTNLSLKNRNFNFGLGYNLGFRQQCYKVTQMSTVSALDIYSITSESCIDVVGETYMFLSVNELHTVEQKTSKNFIQCLAKIIIREEKQCVIYDDGGTLLSNEIIFPSPIDLKNLNIQLLDPYGDIIDLCGMDFSFALEITEVLNTRLYEFYRNYIWLGSLPCIPKNIQDSAVPLLNSIGVTQSPPPQPPL
jgi:hypothetical protein